MIVIGIPTYNEADNIVQLTRMIDAAAQKQGISITLVNADSASSDGTSDVFLQTVTHHPKVAIKNRIKGKGRNIASILEWVADTGGIDGCIFIDGDVTSFEPEWLERHSRLLSEGADYVMPLYARNYQEGNTTNHFVYPLLGMHFDGNAPRQPISGDFGVSRQFAKHLLKQHWHDYSWGYGIDIFMTLHALYGSFNVAEVALKKKLHKPSFDKMIPMFVEVAASYYATIGLLRDTATRDTHPAMTRSVSELIATTAIPQEKIAERRMVAEGLYYENKMNSCVPELDELFSNDVDTLTWACVLIAHEKSISVVEPKVLARSILPWYLKRVVSYLETNSSPSSATKEIDAQFHNVVELWQHETYSN